METIVVVEQHRNHSYSRCRLEGSPRFGSSPAGKFNCRTFQSGPGILPTPFKHCSATESKIACCISPKALPPCSNAYSEDCKHFISPMKTAWLPVGIRVSKRERSGFDEDFSYSELWAGPAYSNSPPPSSLPIPKFSLQQKRAASLDLPRSAPVKLHSFAKSAPSSPTRESSPSTRDLFLSDDSATQTLRRMLNLDITD